MWCCYSWWYAKQGSHSYPPQYCHSRLALRERRIMVASGTSTVLDHRHCDQQSSDFAMSNLLVTLFAARGTTLGLTWSLLSLCSDTVGCCTAGSCCALQCRCVRACVWIFSTIQHNSTRLKLSTLIICGPAPWGVPHACLSMSRESRSQCHLSVLNFKNVSGAVGTCAIHPLRTLH